MPLGDPDESRLHRPDVFPYLVDRVTQPETESGRNLIVAASPGVEFLSGVADQLDQLTFDERMHVLSIAFKKVRRIGTL
jgi:hypothetical protein